MLTSASAFVTQVDETNAVPSMFSEASAQDSAQPQQASDQCIAADDVQNTSTGYFVGDKVQVWSKGKGGWVDAVVDQVFTEECMSDGYQVPAGVVQVSFGRDMKKFIRQEQADSQLRKFAAAGGA